MWCVKTKEKKESKEKYQRYVGHAEELVQQGLGVDCTRPWLAKVMRRKRRSRKKERLMKIILLFFSFYWRH